MKTEEFEKMCKEQFELEQLLIELKGQEYTKGNEDRLYNFKQIASEIGVEPIKVWYTYFKKHVDSITSYVKNGSVKSNESIESRFSDARVYLLIGLALIQEKENTNESI